MKPIEELYPDMIFYSYQPLLESYGYKILLQVDDDDYQGDSRLIFQDGTRYGLLIFGWGSCSGCDALQACSSYKEVEELRQELHGQIEWFTASELLDYCKTHDWQGDYSWNTKGTREFVERTIELLEAVVAK